MSNQLTPFEAAKQPETLQSLLAAGSYKSRFEQVLGARAPQFISSILSLGSRMRDVEPRSVIASAAIAASLDLPIDPNLGYAWIVPYKKGDKKFGQFQLGSKGLIQLAQRTAAYAGMNAEPVNAEAYKGRNEIGEPIIDWDMLDDEKPIAGYVFAFKMINGFTKVCYWSKEKVERHAKRYSQSYRGGYDSPWKDNFDRMALKTVVANELRRWGMLSVEMQGAFANDHAIRRDIDAPAEFPDIGDDITRPKFDAPEDTKELAAAGLAPAQPPVEPPPAKRKRAAKPAVESAPTAPLESPQPAAPAPPAATNQFASLVSDDYNTLRGLMQQSGITDEEVIKLCKERGVMAPELEELMQLADEKIKDLVTSWPAVAGQIRINRRNAQNK